MKNLMRKFGLFLLVMFATSLYAQQFPPVQIDPKVRYGKLENGLTYYIRHNVKPKERAEFFIAQNVGAILENDDQNGLAHFLEHMAFNGTKNFPGKKIIEYFETIGVKFGNNINAYTSLDETVYNLSNVPTVRQGIIDSALLVLHDWSGCISLEDKEIDSERGVIREEWRTGAGAERRMWKASNYLKYPGSQYAKRDVIGDTAVINNFSYKTLRNYYQKWYRPDQQAIFIVGDINVDQVEASIKVMFADIPAKANAGERPIYPITDNKEPIISVVRDPEARMTRIELEFKHDVLPKEIKLSIAGYVNSLMNNIVSKVMENRFDEITQQADAPFVGGMAFYGELVKSKDAFQLLVVPKEGKELEGLQALLLETEKVRRFGFTNSEVERAKSQIIKNTETAYNDRDNQENGDLVEEYVRNFLSDEVIPGVEWEYQIQQALMPQITTDKINEAVKAYVTDENLIISFMAPEKAAVKIPANELVLEAVQAVKKAEITARAEENLNQPLVKNTPKPGKIRKTATNKLMETTEWTLSNGVKVVFKQTDFKKDEIIFNAFSQGGLSKIKETADLPSGLLTAGLISNNGYGDYPLVELNKMLSGKIVSVVPKIGNYDESLSGNSSVSDFETLMQLIFLSMTAPRKDDNSFAAAINMYKTTLANSASDPRRAFSDSINLMVGNHHQRVMLVNLATIEKISQDKAFEIYKQRMGNPADFTFIFTGNVNPVDEKVKNAVLTYLGGIKTCKKAEKFVDNNIRKPKGIVKNYFNKEMKVKKSSNFIIYAGKAEYNLQNKVAMTAIGNILNIRYLESIREKEGGTYGVGVRGSLNNTPVQEAVIMMQFDTDPEKQEKLMGIIHQEVNEIVKNGPRADDLQKVKENMLKKYEEDLRDNGWWTNSLVNFYQDKLNYISDYKNAVNALSPEVIKAMLTNLTDQGNILEVVMKPAQ